jgi:hypothetical protein
MATRWGGSIASAVNNVQRNEEFECQTVFKTKSSAPVLCLAVQGSSLYAGTNAGDVLVWDVNFGDEAPSRRFTVERNSPVRAVQASDAGVLHVGIDLRVVTLDAGSGEVLFTGQREGCQGLVASLLCKGDLVYAGYTDGCVRVWRNGEWKGSYRGHQGTVLSLALVGKEMFTGSKDQTIMTWNLKEAKPHVIWRGKSPQNGAIRGLDVHRGTVWFGDGTRVLAQNIATGMRVFKCEGHEGVVKRIALHGPTDTLFSIADDKHVFVWDTNTGQQVATCRGHTDAVNAIAVDDRGFLYSAGADNTVREWVTPSLLARAADGPPAAAAAVSSPPTAARSRTASRADPLDDPPKPMKAAPKRTGSVAAFNAPTTQSRDSSNGGTPTRAAPKRTSAAPAKKSTDLEALEALDDDQVPLDKLDDDDVKPSDWDDIDNLLDFGDL